MTRLFLVGCILLCFALAASAQDVAPNGVRIRLYTPAGVLAYESPVSIPLSGSIVTCGLIPQPAIVGTPINPRRIQFRDPANGTLACVIDTSAVPPAPVPDGNYELALIGDVNGQFSADSARIAFIKGVVAIRVLDGVVFIQE